MNKKFKIGIDYHGVITANPDFFKKFNRYALDNNCLIYVISGGHTKDIEKYLTEKQISYSAIWSTLDYYDKLQEVRYNQDGTFKVDDILWDSAKALYCAQNDINVHIDDSVVYGKYFTTPFCLYNILEKKCLINDKYISFNQTPEKVLKSLLDVTKK
ncbi:MAG: hypothetical protein E7016_00735 [Alphaproteobacteria bacterium]|nr:hypothetical protein [Alphaproteobacteria bacterium]